MLRARGRRLLANPGLELVVAADAWSEAEHELRKRVDLLGKHGRLDPSSATELLDEALATIAARVAVAQPDVYGAEIERARRRVPRDPRDGPTVALALTLSCGIWTGDHDFLGCGVPV